MVGRAIHAARLECRWSQAELARRLGTTQPQISRLKRRTRDHIDVDLASRALDLLGIRIVMDARTLGMAGRREQRDAVHAACVATVCRRLIRAGWDVRAEVEIGTGRYRGWIDVLAYRPVDRALLVVEVKTEIHDVGSMMRTLSWYRREAADAARRIRWQSRNVSVALILLCSTENDIRVHTNFAALWTTFRGAARELSAWLADAQAPRPEASIAMVDPRSRRADWLRPTRSDGRRTRARYEDYRDAARVLRPRQQDGHAKRA